MAGDGEWAGNPLVAKLMQFTPLSDEDIRVLEALCSREKRFKGGVDILAEGRAAARAARVSNRLSVLIPSGPWPGREGRACSAACESLCGELP